MANSKISALPEGTPTATDAIPYINDMGGTPVEMRTSLTLFLAGLRGLTEAVHVLTDLAADGAIVIPWASGRIFEIDTQGFDITGISESNGAGAGFRFEGSLHIINSGATDSACDLAGIAHGLSGVLTVPAGEEDLVLIWSTNP